MHTLDRRTLKVKIERLQLKAVLKRQGMPYTRVSGRKERSRAPAGDCTQEAGEAVRVNPTQPPFVWGRLLFCCRGPLPPLL